MILDKESIIRFVVWIGVEPIEIFLFFAFVDLLKNNAFQVLSHQLINCDHENSLLDIIFNGSYKKYIMNPKDSNVCSNNHKITYDPERVES